MVHYSLDSMSKYQILLPTLCLAAAAYQCSHFGDSISILRTSKTVRNVAWFSRTYIRYYSVNGPFDLIYNARDWGSMVIVSNASLANDIMLGVFGIWEAYWAGIILLLRPFLTGIFVLRISQRRPFRPQFQQAAKATPKTHSFVFATKPIKTTTWKKSATKRLLRCLKVGTQSVDATRMTLKRSSARSGSTSKSHELPQHSYCNVCIDTNNPVCVHFSGLLSFSLDPRPFTVSKRTRPRDSRWWPSTQRVLFISLTVFFRC